MPVKNRFDLMAGLMPSQSLPWERQLAIGLEPAEPFTAPAQRSAIDASRQCFASRQTQGTAPFIISMILVQASERRSSACKPKRAAVSISSGPSNIPALTSHACRNVLGRVT